MGYEGLNALGPFKPAAKYNHGVDVLVYRSESGTCVAERVDAFLTILWDREYTRLVGVRLKGFRYVFGLLKDKLGWTDTDFLPLVSVLEGVMTNDLGAKVLAEQRKKYELAKTCVLNFHLTKQDLQDMAA